MVFIIEIFKVQIRQISPLAIEFNIYIYIYILKTNNIIKLLLDLRHESKLNIKGISLVTFIL